MAKMRSGLGKGLNALIPEGSTVFKEESVLVERGTISIDIHRIKPNEDQPRKLFDQGKLESLSSSIKLHGVIQPIVVRKANNDGYELIAGERRWRAARLAGLKEIPCIVKELSDKERMEIALIENLQREDLNPIEEGMAYKALMDAHSLNQEEIAVVIGRSRPHIANTMRLLNLPVEIQKMVRDKKISGGHGRALLGLNNHEFLTEAAQKVVADELSVRATETLVNEINNVSQKQTPKKKLKDSTLVYIEDSLKGILGTKVSIVKGKKRGKIEIEYYGDEELERLVELLQNK